ncbi:hypothetical protein DPEC_G00047740 [Dallia pectoralis]|uniref:Uncharacterized protein n=1 Tax=Dallia pectoralis TaxID=75939 RepID=A0ACC2HB10_DALPE|nr:hypothetical protein DPEC_G00047740 [Dallia pectoralis]
MRLHPTTIDPIPDPARSFSPRSVLAIENPIDFKSVTLELVTARSVLAGYAGKKWCLKTPARVTQGALGQNKVVHVLQDATGGEDHYRACKYIVNA